ncbi:AAA family ATPase [Agathobacter sp.]
MCEFKIRELTLYNYRRFENEKFTLNPQMNVFVGKNGSGKTSVLEAANVMLGAYLAAYKTYVPSRFVYNIKSTDARRKAQISDDNTILITGAISQYPCKVSCKAQWNNNNDLIKFQRVILKEDARTKFGGSNPMQPTVIEWEQKISRADQSDNEVILPLVLYLSTARLWKDGNKKSVKKGVFSRTDAYSHCLDAQHGLDIAFRYIDTLKAVAVEENGGKLFPAYETILKAVNKAFEEELQPGEEIISSTKYEDDMIALKTADGAIIPFQMLSDGYRNVIKIILDIATRMCILNPYLKGEALKKTPGIVLIDEIDLSLHPTWQRRIIGILKEVFPKIQFICATHSPFIIQSLEEGELITLDKPLESEYSGEGLEDIAEDIMGVVLPQYSEKKRKIYEVSKEYFSALNSAETTDEIEKLGKRLAELEAEYSENPAYMAWVHQQYTEKAWNVKKNETGR